MTILSCRYGFFGGSGSLYQAAGQHAEAERSLQESLRRAKALPQAVVDCRHLERSGESGRFAGKVCRRAGRLHRKFPNGSSGSGEALAATSLVNAARVSLPLKQYRESKQRLDQAADILRGLEPSHEQISAFITVGLTYAKLRAFLVELNNRPHARGVSGAS